MDKPVKIFLDDYRQPVACFTYMSKRIGTLASLYLEPWVVVKNYDEFTAVVALYADTVTHISFDHDLADEHYDRNPDSMYGIYQEKTGYDCAVWLKEFYADINSDLPAILIHSMNAVGVENIERVFAGRQQ